MDISKLWVAEYSAKQRCFNIDYLSGALRSNAEMVRTCENNDYLIFGIFDTCEEANAACDRMKELQCQSVDA